MSVFFLEGSLGTGHPLTGEAFQSLEKPKLGAHQKGTFYKINQNQLLCVFVDFVSSASAEQLINYPEFFFFFYLFPFLSVN